MQENLSYTPEEVAKILKISKYTVYEMIKRGELAAYRIGRKVRVEEADLERYKQSFKKCPPNLTQSMVHSPEKNLNLDQGLIICGQDIVLDILTRHLEREIPNVRFLRKYNGSIDGLLALYHGTVNIATAHLWDRDTGEYNIPYVRRLLPGHQTVIYNLVYRMAGFYVPKGNPKNIKGWLDLKRPDIRLVNRECGSGARVLLDEMLRKLDIVHSEIQGYDCEESSHLAIASCVARGEADVGVGIEKAALQVPEIEFIPLQKERYDLIFKKENIHSSPIQAILRIINSPFFQGEIQGMGGYDLSDMGKKMGET